MALDVVFDKYKSDKVIHLAADSHANCVINNPIIFT